MGEAQFEKVVKGLECFVNHVNGPYRDDCRKAECDYLKAGDCEMMVMSDALALIRQQQERIAELEAELGQRDYNAAVEMQQYCERYEPTYNPEDGSM